MLNKTINISILGFAFVSNAIAYELRTHAAITEQAVLGSSISDPERTDELGISNDSTNPFDDKYYDVHKSNVVEILADKFENTIIDDDIGAEPLSIAGWLMRGAIREDDHTRRSFPCRINAPNPQYAGIKDRPKNHFYDPWTNSPLSISFFGIGKRAPEWGLGSTEPFQIPQQEDTGRDNHYTLFDTIEAMYRALTAHSTAGLNTIKPGSMAPSDEDDQESVRNAYWATTFRSIGDVIHLIQDMAQPQHTRNDAHSGACATWVQDLFTGHASVYERYIENRARGSDFRIPGGGLVTADPLDYNSYPTVPEFDDYASYFSTNHIDSDITVSKGLADYSHRGFFSAGTNLGGSNYTYPDNNSASYTASTHNLDWQGNPLPNGQTIDLLIGSVSDSVTNSTDQIAMTTKSVWDEFLTNQGSAPSYNLTKENYDDMADLLIPRAASYSVGFINYFLRGRLKIKGVSTQSNGQELQIDLENASTTGTINFDLSNGKFELFYKADDGFIKPMTILNGMTPSASIAHGALHQITATLPQDIDPKESRPFTVVYTGLIGQEPGIIGHRLSAEKFYITHYDNSNSGSGSVVKYDIYGNIYATYPSGNTPIRTRNIAVIDGDRFVDDETNTVFKNGLAFKSVPTTPNGLWLNANYLYVAALGNGSGTGPVVFESDIQTGATNQTIITITPASPFGTFQTVGANDTRICVTDDGDSVATLFDIDGNLIKQLVSFQDPGAGISDVVSCGSSTNNLQVPPTNLQFVHVNKSQVGFLQVYEENGDFVSEVMLDAGVPRGFGIAVSNNYVVIPAFYSNAAYVVRRDRDSAGIESYAFERKLNLSGPSIYPYDASIDLTQPTQ
jgi:hypothetical protein